MTCEGAELTFLQDFADLHLSAQYLPPVIQSKVDRITTRVTVILIFSLPKWWEHGLEFLARFSTSTFFPILFLPSWEISSFRIMFTFMFESCFILFCSKLEVFVSSKSPKCSGNHQFQLVQPPSGSNFWGSFLNAWSIFLKVTCFYIQLEIQMENLNFSTICCSIQAGYLAITCMKLPWYAYHWKKKFLYSQSSDYLRNSFWVHIFSFKLKIAARHKRTHTTKKHLMVVITWGCKHNNVQV